jgi:hypothetical protein
MSYRYFAHSERLSVQISLQLGISKQHIASALGSAHGVWVYVSAHIIMVARSAACGKNQVEGVKSVRIEETYDFGLGGKPVWGLGAGVGNVQRAGL